jgi:hypothetical protein
MGDERCPVASIVVRRGLSTVVLAREEECSHDGAPGRWPWVPPHAFPGFVIAAHGASEQQRTDAGTAQPQIVLCQGLDRGFIFQPLQRSLPSRLGPLSALTPTRLLPTSDQGQLAVVSRL